MAKLIWLDMLVGLLVYTLIVPVSGLNPFVGTVAFLILGILLICLLIGILRRIRKSEGRNRKVVAAGLLLVSVIVPVLGGRCQMKHHSFPKRYYANTNQGL